MSATGGDGGPGSFYDPSGTEDEWVDDDEGDGPDDNEEEYLDEDDWENGDDEAAGLEEADDGDNSDSNSLDDTTSCRSDPDLPATLPHPDLRKSRITALDTTNTIKNLLRDIADLFQTSSKPLREGVRLAVKFIEATSGNRFLKRITESFIKTTLNFWKQVAQRERITGQRDLAGSALHIILQYVTLQFRFHPLILQPQSVHKAVMKSPHRTNIQREFIYRSKGMRAIIQPAKKFLGLGTLGKLHQSSLDPGSSSRPRFIEIHGAVGGLKQFLNMILLNAGRAPDDIVTGVPKLQFDLQLGFFLRNLRTSQDVSSSRKRKRDEKSPNEGLVQEASTPLDPALTPAGASAIHQALSEVLDELSPSGLAFNDLDHLRQWKTRAADRFRRIVSFCTTRAEAIQTSFFETATVLMVSSALVYQRYNFGPAATIVQVFVATIREAYEHDPSDTTRLRLINALGVLVVIFSQEKRTFEAIRGAEEALFYLRTFQQDHSTEHVQLMAALKLLHSRSLLKSVGGILEASLMKVCLLRQSARVANQAVDFARSAVEANPTDIDVRGDLAYALSWKGNVCRELSKKCHDIKMSAAINSAPITPQTLADHVDDPSCGTIDDAGFACEESVTIYRELAIELPKLYEPLLANAILTTAAVYHSPFQSKPERAILCFKEAISIIQGFSESFPGLFDPILREAYLDLAVRLRWENRLAEADPAYENSLQLVPQGSTVQGPIWQARALLCFRLERYEEALAHAKESCALMRRCTIQYEELMEAAAISGVCQWVMYGNKEEALHSLEESISTSEFSNLDFRQPPLLRNVTDRHFLFCLVLGWCAAVQCALGRHEEANMNGEGAVSLMRFVMGSVSATLCARQFIEPYEFILPHLLVLLAGIHSEGGRHDEAKEAVQESLELGEAADGPTRKTALLLKARLLDREGSEVEAAAVRAEAETIAFKGFLEALGR